MKRKRLSRRAFLRVGGLGVVGLAGCVLEGDGYNGQPGADRTTTGTPTATTDEPTTTKPTTETTAEPMERSTVEPTDEPRPREPLPTKKRRLKSGQPKNGRPTRVRPSKTRRPPETRRRPRTTADRTTRTRTTGQTSVRRIRGLLQVEYDSRELCKCAGRPLDSAEDLEPWADISGSIAAEPGGFVGTQSIVMETTGDPYFCARRLFSDGIDLSDRDLSLAIDLERPEGEDIEVRLFAPDVENSLVCERAVESAG